MLEGGRSDVRLSVRMYCKDLKPPEKDQNNTEFLIEFNKYIDSETPNHPSCECVRAMHRAAVAGNVCVHANTG